MAPNTNASIQGAAAAEMQNALVEINAAVNGAPAAAAAASKKRAPAKKAAAVQPSAPSSPAPQAPPSAPSTPANASSRPVVAPGAPSRKRKAAEVSEEPAAPAAAAAPAEEAKKAAKKPRAKIVSDGKPHLVRKSPGTKLVNTILGKALIAVGSTAGARTDPLAARALKIVTEQFARELGAKAAEATHLGGLAQMQLRHVEYAAKSLRLEILNPGKEHDVTVGEGDDAKVFRVPEMPLKRILRECLAAAPNAPLRRAGEDKGKVSAQAQVNEDALELASRLTAAYTCGLIKKASELLAAGKKRSTMEVKYLAFALKESSDLLDHALPVDLLVAAATAKKARGAAKKADCEAMVVAE